MVELPMVRCAAVWTSTYTQIYDCCHRIDGSPARAVCVVGREDEQCGLSRPPVCDGTANILLIGLHRCHLLRFPNRLADAH